MAEELRLRYDAYEKHAVLKFEIIRADEEGVPFDWPALSICDDETGEHYTLNRDDARKLRDFIERML